MDENDHVLGIVDRGEAIRNRWLHRAATIVCRDAAGRILVHRRPQGVSRFPGQYNWMLGGAVDAGETYRDAAARELSEELGARVQTRFLLKFLCDGEISPYWLGLHEATVDTVTPNPSEIAWYDWLSETTLRHVLHAWPFVPDCREAFARYVALPERTPGDSCKRTPTWPKHPPHVIDRESNLRTPRWPSPDAEFRHGPGSGGS